MCDKGCGKYKLRKLSESPYGGIVVDGTSDAARRPVHYAIASKAANEWDEIYIKATNISTTAAKLTVQWGWRNATDRITITIPPQAGLTDVIPGLILQDAAEVTTYADTANVIVVHGYVHRYEAAP